MNCPRNVHYVPVDFEKDDLEVQLLQQGFDSKGVTVAIWEGVVSYLTAAAVDQTIRILARLLAAGSTLILTYVHAGALDGSVQFAEAARWKSSVSSTGEPFIFGFQPSELPAYLRERGFVLSSDQSTAEASPAICTPLHRNEPGSDLYRVSASRRAL